MQVGRSLVVALAPFAAAASSGCTSPDATVRTAPSSLPSSPASPSTASRTPVPVPAGSVPVARDGGYADAVATFGEAQVQQAVADHARIARIALADCWRWTTGEMHPELTSLLSPALRGPVEQELQLPPGVPPSLLSDPPEDDGNGHDLAAAARSGCDDSAPMRYGSGSGPNAVHVDHSPDGAGLVQVASYAMDVTFGDTVVGAAQDWVFTSTPTAAGWRLTDAEARAHLNWFPALPG